MPVIQESIVEDLLTFHFPAGAMSTKYDGWSHYRNQFNGAFGGTKAVDLIFVEPGTTWLIEVKDYRHHARTKPTDLHEEIAHKVRDTLAGLISAGLHANDADEKRVGRQAVRMNRFRVVLHLEQRKTQSRLFPIAVNPANVLLKLRKTIKSIDPHPLVVHRTSLHPDMCWQVVNTNI
ncbi:hypothetical protein [Hydrogenophaga sp.]|uniref:hypothetical protein n=1 Tax=Hydrogenophaga sp. TaxID=1904254 RepID=UPI00271D9569|nr:hypothetical protein [Hydrogenophaga sp.]MDO9435045.1 hypothetical protein [Hydrogenophaga sp.]